MKKDCLITLFFLLCLSLQAQQEIPQLGTEPATVILTAGQSNTDGRVRNSDLPEYIIRKYTHLPFVCGTFSKHSKQGAPEVVAAMRRLQEEDNDFYVVDVSDATLQTDVCYCIARIVLKHYADRIYIG